MGRKKKNKTKTKLVSPVHLSREFQQSVRLNKKKEANSNLNAAQTDRPELSISCRRGGRNWGAQSGVGSRSVCSQINNCASFCNVPEEWLLFPDFSLSLSRSVSFLALLSQRLWRGRKWLDWERMNSRKSLPAQNFLQPSSERVRTSGRDDSDGLFEDN